MVQLTSIVFLVHMEVKGKQNSLVTNILQNILFYVPQKKESHTSLERHESE